MVGIDGISEADPGLSVAGDRRAGELKVDVLGPVLVTVSNRPVAVARRQERCLVGVLGVEAGRFVSVGRLVGLLWPGEPPGRPTSAIQSMVSHVRRGLRAAGEPPDVLEGGPAGYRLAIDPTAVDATRFRHLVAAARALEDPQRRVDLLHEALSLWRGPLVADLEDPLARDLLGPDLVALREAAHEDWLRARVDIGDHAAVVDELRPLIRERPHAEGPWLTLMLALYRSGRREEAIEAYRRVRTSWVEDLGLEPGTELRDLHLAILRDDVPRRTPTTFAELITPPQQLPADVSPFTGRSALLARLDTALLATASGQGVGWVGAHTALLVGGPGVGKTALAVHWAHRARRQFPDGQVFIPLRSHSAGKPVTAIEALANCLVALGVAPARTPATVDQAAALLRTVLARRRVLLVLDDAADADQVRPFLPSGRSRVVVTSRNRLSGLLTDGSVVRWPVEVLDAGEARGLLAGALGSARVDTVPDDAARLTRACGYLPLALRVVAAQLADRPGRTLAEQAELLERPGRLGRLHLDDDVATAVEAAFEMSYRALPKETAAVFRLLGASPIPDLSVHAAAALAGLTGTEVQDHLDRLVSRHLAGSTPAGRHTLHDLISEYVAGLAQQADGNHVIGEAIQRLAMWYLGQVCRACELLFPWIHQVGPSDPAGHPACFDDVRGAMAFLRTEDRSLRLLIGHLLTGEQPALGWRLTDLLRGWIWISHGATLWQGTVEAALAAAEQAGDRQFQAALLITRASVLGHLTHPSQAMEPLSHALEFARQHGDPGTQAAAYKGHGLARLAGGDLPAADLAFHAALRLYRRMNWSLGQAIALADLVEVDLTAGRLADAHDHITVAVELIGADPSGATLMRCQELLGRIQHARGQYTDAETTLTQCLDYARDCGDDNLLHLAGDTLAQVYRDTGRYKDALDLANVVASTIDSVTNPWHRANRLVLSGTVHGAAGNLAAAQAALDQAVEICKQFHLPYAQARALLGLADVHRRRDHAATATHLAQQALSIAQERGFTALYAQAQNPPGVGSAAHTSGAARPSR